MFRSLEFFPEVAAKGRHLSWLVVTKERLESGIRDGKKPTEIFNPSFLRWQNYSLYILLRLKIICMIGLKKNTYYKLWVSFLIYKSMPCTQDIVPDTDLHRKLLLLALHFLVFILMVMYEKDLKTSLQFRRLKSGSLKNKLI